MDQYLLLYVVATKMLVILFADSLLKKYGMLSLAKLIAMLRHVLVLHQQIRTSMLLALLGLAGGHFQQHSFFTKASISNQGEYKYVANGPLLACSWVDKLVHGWTSLFTGGQACSWVDKLVHGWSSLFMGGQACSRVDKLVHGWTSLFTGGQACSRVVKLVHGWTSLLMGGQACSRVDKLVHGWTSLFTGGQACSRVHVSIVHSLVYISIAMLIIRYIYDKLSPFCSFFHNSNNRNYYSRTSELRSPQLRKTRSTGH